MGIRVQLKELEVPEEDPFRNDLLSRKEPIETLTTLIGGIEGPCVLAVDSAWGTGKTSFLEMWSAHLSLQGFTVAQFNAWATDFTETPFVALTTELLQALDPEGHKETIERTKAAAKKVLKHAALGGVRVATGGVLDLAPLLESYAEESLREYEKGKDAIAEFRERLTELAELCKPHPLVIIVDELDRCRPLYAIELLESAKHLFSVDGVIFVVATDRTSLAHSIRSVYGAGFDATGYLQRFFDVDYTLPTPDRRAFVDSLLRASGIPEYFDRTADREAGSEHRVIKDMTTAILGESSASLRSISQGIHRLGLVLGSLPDNMRAFAISAATLVILRTLKPQLYRDFVSGRASDREVVEEVFDDPRLAEVRRDHKGQLFEAAIIAGGIEMGRLSELRPHLESVKEKHQTAGEGVDPAPWPEEIRHARDVLEMVEFLTGKATWRGSFGFQYSLKRLEEFSGE